MADLQLIVVTPERKLVDRRASFVALPLFDGEIGIAPDHSPLIGRLGAGELRIGREDEPERYFVEGGFVEVLDNVVSVLTRRAMPASALDELAAREQLSEARARTAHSDDLLEARERDVAIARAQLRAARRAMG